MWLLLATDACAMHRHEPRLPAQRIVLRELVRCAWLRWVVGGEVAVVTSMSTFNYDYVLHKAAADGDIAKVHASSVQEVRACRIVGG